jgi:hypothetical protein
VLSCAFPAQRSAQSRVDNCFREQAVTNAAQLADLLNRELALRADGYADNTVKAGRNAVVEIRERHFSNVARGWFAGPAPCRWVEAEGEAGRDATAGAGRVIIGR